MSTIQETFLLADGAVDWAQVAIVIPTFNAKKLWMPLRDGLVRQGIPAGQVLIVDSSSDDGTRDLAAAEGFEVVRIDHRDFNHGGTRQAALDYVPWASIVVYLTQDAVLATPDSIEKLLTAFEDESVAAAYGRQLPRPGAGPIEAHARLFNYPAQSDVRDFESRHTLGIKATFLSNSFSAYRVDALREVGGFPSEVIVSEDTLVTGKLLLAGWKAAYVAEAQVFHSHALTIFEEFQRYFDIGVGHRRATWLRDCFGKPAGEGRRFVMSELAFLGPRYPHLIPFALLRTMTKVLGYQLGMREAKLGKEWSKRFSHHKSFWDRTGLTCESQPPTLQGSEIPTSGPVC